MKNKEIEELKYKNIPVFILEALGDLTNGAINYYQEPKATLEKQNIILSYIEQLETDYKEANNSITWWANRFNAVERDNRDYKSRIDKAFEYIHNYFVLGVGSEYVNKLENILKGDSDGNL